MTDSSGRGLKTSGVSLRRCPLLTPTRQSSGDTGVVSELGLAPRPKTRLGWFSLPINICQLRAGNRIQSTPSFSAKRVVYSCITSKTRTLSAHGDDKCKAANQLNGCASHREGCCPIGTGYQDAWPTIFPNFPSLLQPNRVHSTYSLPPLLFHEPTTRSICPSKGINGRQYQCTTTDIGSSFQK